MVFKLLSILLLLGFSLKEAKAFENILTIPIASTTDEKMLVNSYLISQEFLKRIDFDAYHQITLTPIFSLNQPSAPSDFIQMNLLVYCHGDQFEAGFSSSLAKTNDPAHILDPLIANTTKFSATLEACNKKQYPIKIAIEVATNAPQSSIGGLSVQIINIGNIFKAEDICINKSMIENIKVLNECDFNRPIKIQPDPLSHLEAESPLASIPTELRLIASFRCITGGDGQAIAQFIFGSKSTFLPANLTPINLDLSRSKDRGPDIVKIIGVGPNSQIHGECQLNLEAFYEFPLAESIQPYIERYLDSYRANLKNLGLIEGVKRLNSDAQTLLMIPDKIDELILNAEFNLDQLNQELMALKDLSPATESANARVLELESPGGLLEASAAEIDRWQTIKWQVSNSMTTLFSDCKNVENPACFRILYDLETIIEDASSIDLKNLELISDFLGREAVRLSAIGSDVASKLETLKMSIKLKL